MGFICAVLHVCNLVVSIWLNVIILVFKDNPVNEMNGV